MHRLLKLVHIGGLVISLGSIFTFLIISTLMEGASLENITFGRKIISTGTNILTLPGMYVLTITGIWMGYKCYGLKRRFFQLKLLLIMLVFINGYFFILPSVTLATEITVRSLVQGHLLLEYKTAYIKESMFGAVNILLIIAAAVIGVWKVGDKSITNS